MPWIDHLCIGVRHIYEGVERLRDETGLDNYDGGWFPGSGIVQRQVPLGEHSPGHHCYIEVESPGDRDMAMSHFFGRWFESVLADANREDRYMGWVIAVDTLDELEVISERIGIPIAGDGVPTEGNLKEGDPGYREVEMAWRRRRPDGQSHNRRIVPSARQHQWPRGLPMFMVWDDKELDHPDTIPAAKTVNHQVQPLGISWVEVGDEALTSAWLGPVQDSLDVRYVDGPAGLYAAGIRTTDGELVVRRSPVPLELISEFTP